MNHESKTWKAVAGEIGSGFQPLDGFDLIPDNIKIQPSKGSFFKSNVAFQTKVELFRTPTRMVKENISAGSSSRNVNKKYEYFSPTSTVSPVRHLRDKLLKQTEDHEYSGHLRVAKHIQRMEYHRKQQARQLALEVKLLTRQGSDYIKSLEEKAKEIRQQQAKREKEFYQESAVHKILVEKKKRNEMIMEDARKAIRRHIVVKDSQVVPPIIPKPPVHSRTTARPVVFCPANKKTPKRIIPIQSELSKILCVSGVDDGDAATKAWISTLSPALQEPATELTQHAEKLLDTLGVGKALRRVLLAGMRISHDQEEASVSTSGRRKRLEVRINDEQAQLRAFAKKLECLEHSLKNKKKNAGAILLPKSCFLKDPGSALNFNHSTAISLGTDPFSDVKSKNHPIAKQSYGGENSQVIRDVQRGDLWTSNGIPVWNASDAAKKRAQKISEALLVERQHLEFSGLESTLMDQLGILHEALVVAQREKSAKIQSLTSLNENFEEEMLNEHRIVLDLTARIETLSDKILKAKEVFLGKSSDSSSQNDKAKSFPTNNSSTEKKSVTTRTSSKNENEKSEFSLWKGLASLGKWRAHLSTERNLMKSQSSRSLLNASQGSSKLIVGKSGKSGHVAAQRRFRDRNLQSIKERVAFFKASVIAMAVTNSQDSTLFSSGGTM